MGLYFARFKAAVPLKGVTLNRNKKSKLLISGLAIFGMLSFGIQSATAGPVVQLTFAALGGIDNNFKPVIAQWNAANPGIQVTVQTIPSGSTGQTVAWFSQQAQAGTAPDLFNNLDTYANSLADLGFSQDLKKLAGAAGTTLKISDFNTFFLSSYVPLNLPSQVTGVPIAADAVVMFYNKDIFKKAKIAVPTNNWTYAQEMATCVAISKWGATQKPQIWGASGGPGGGSKSIWQAQFNPMLKAFGALVYDKNTQTSQVGSPAAVKAWELLLQPWTNGCYPKYSIESGKNAPSFSGGQSAMEASVRALLPSYRATLKNFDVALLPRVNGQPTNGGGSYGFGIYSGSKNKEAAWKFLDWFYTTTDGGINTLEDSYSLVPPNTQGITNGSWRKLAGPPGNIQVFADAIAQSYIAPALPGNGNEVMDQALLTAEQQVILQHVSIAKAFMTAQNTINAAIKEALKK